jgi:subtilisin family serine protease
MQLSKRTKVVNMLNPVEVTAAAATMTQTYVDTAGYDRIRYIIQVGALTTDKTVDAYINEGATTSPATKITGSDITQIEGVSSDGDKIVIIEVQLSGERLRYQVPEITVGSGGTALLSCIAELYGPQQMPIDDGGADELVEV